MRGRASTPVTASNCSVANGHLPLLPPRPSHSEPARLPTSCRRDLTLPKRLRVTGSSAWSFWRVCWERKTSGHSGRGEPAGLARVALRAGRRDRCAHRSAGGRAVRVDPGLLLHQHVALAVAGGAVIQRDTGVESPDGAATDLGQAAAVADLTLHSRANTSPAVSGATLQRGVGGPRGTACVQLLVCRRAVADRARAARRPRLRRGRGRRERPGRRRARRETSTASAR